MEPERKIEKWLRAYAKKRKGQSGGPFDLHPATRRLLHGEIARNKSKSGDKEDESTSLWEVFRRDWAFLLGFALCIFLVAAVFFHGLTTSKHVAQTAAPGNLAQLPRDARSQADNEKIPETLGVPTTNRRSTLADNKDFNRLTNNTAPTTFAFNTPPAPQRAEIPPPASMPADNLEAALPQPAPPPPAVTTASPAADLPVAEAPAAPAMQPAPAGHAGESAFSKNEEPQTRAASRQMLTAQNRFKNTSAPRNIPVLTKFQVQQNGNTIRIVDHDGSVYEGTLFQGEPAIVTATVQSSMKPTDKSAGIISGQAHESPEGAFPARENSNAAATTAGGIPPGNAPHERSPSAQNYFFMVSGTNRTLNQRVIFTGNFKANLATAESLKKTPQLDSDSLNSVNRDGFGGGGIYMVSAATNQFAQFPWSNLLIKGTAIINHTNRISINAKPVTSTNK